MIGNASTQALKKLLHEQSFIGLLADHSGDFPDPVVVMPDMHKLGIPDVIGLIWMVKLMYSDLDRPVPVQRVNLKCVLDSMCAVPFRKRSA